MEKTPDELMKEFFEGLIRKLATAVDGSDVAPMTRDEARAARDAARPAYRAMQARMKELNATIYINGNYDPAMPLEERAQQLSELRQIQGDILILARHDGAYNDIIAYRPDAKVDPDNWEAVDAQGWKKVKAEAAQEYLAGCGTAATVKDYLKAKKARGAK